MKIYYNVEEEYHLGLEEKDLKNYKNPLEELTEFQKENMHLYILNILKNPKYFHTTCKILLNIDLLPIQTAILRNIWTHSFPIYIASRGFGKSFLLAVYAILRSLFIPGTKIVIVGAAFRQSKVIFEYMETIWKNAPLLRSLCSDNSGPRRDIDRCTFTINDSKVWAVPLGTGEKIRGLRAHVTIADEFNSIDTEIYETVIAGFSSVTSNPVENAKKEAKKAALQARGEWTEEDEIEHAEIVQNQAILSGTCGYDFEPFANYWKKYRAVLNSRGDLSKLMDTSVAPDDDEDEDDNTIPDYMKSMDWREFCIIRIPYELIPKGFMSDATVARSRATMHSGTYEKEYGTIFSSDSMGFFKRKAIQMATATDKNCNKPQWPPWCPDPFDPAFKAYGDMDYVMGIDPASEQDNLAIVILECHPEHQRIVYSWTTNKKDFQARQRAGIVDTTDYFSFVSRKIRELMKAFNIVCIGIDSQGGGHTIAESLKDHDKLREGEVPLLPVIDPKKKQDTDTMPGLHILEMINFRDSTWTSKANHGLRQDIEDKTILFPRFDSATLVLMAERDKANFEKLKNAGYKPKDLKMYDTYEDCALEIEELKEELSNIIVEINDSGSEKFTTPQIKTENNKKGRMRKDRYSALVIANMIARSKKFAPAPRSYVDIGSFVGKEIKDGDLEQPAYVGSDFAQKLAKLNIFGAVIR